VERNKFKFGIRRQSVGETPGEDEIAEFRCKARSEGYASLQFISTMIALGGMVASQIGQNPTYAVLLLALIIALGATISILRPRTASVCTVSKEGIKIVAESGRGRSRFLKWRDISRFSWSGGGEAGGTIYIYPKGLFSVLRREVIETLRLSDFNLLFNALTTRTAFP